MRYSRYYTKKNRDGGRTVVRLGPVASATMRPFVWIILFITFMLPGVFIGDCICAVGHIQSSTAERWIIAPLAFGGSIIGLPLFRRWGRKPAKRR